MSKKRPGVYLIRCKVNGKGYIGSSIDPIQKRWCYHRSNLRMLRSTRHLQADWDTYGEETFEFLILENLIPDEEIVRNREQYWMDKLKTWDREFGYNICPSAKWEKGVKCAPETCERIGLSKRGTKASEATLEKLRARTWKPEQYEKYAAARQDGRLKPPPNLTGYKRSESFKENLRQNRLGDANPNKGFPFKIVGPDGQVIEGINLHKWCRERGLDSSAMKKVMKGKGKSYRGYTAPI